MFKTSKGRWMAVLALAALMLLLSACKINIISDIKSDGSGTFITEYGFTADEIASYGMEVDENFCVSMQEDTSDMPDGVVTQEQRGDETWCVFSAPFASLDELRTLYAGMDITINTLSLTSGKLTYDVTMDTSGDSDFGMGMMEAYWVVKMPGTVSEHNADQKDGSTLRWSLTNGGLLNMRAVSSTGGGAWVWWAVGIGLACLCLVLVVVIVVVVILVVRKNKKAPAPTPVSAG